MNWKSVARTMAWVVGAGVVVIAVGLVSFCAALRAERKSNVLELPDWTDRPREEAAAQAASLGLGFEVGEERHDAAISSGRVISQEPAPKTLVRRGRAVRVVVSLGGETLNVPAVAGQPARQADLEIRRQGLSSGWETRVHDASIEAGRVMDQFPAGGALATSGERVDRLVSDGPRDARFVMPDLRGRPLRVAQEWITLCGFRAGGLVRVSDGSAASGTIVRQRPLPGWPVDKRDAIELTVAE